MITWKIETRTLSALKDHPRNPRQLSKHDAEHLTRSIEKFGITDKPIINTDGTIIGGHQRKKILKKLGYKEIECWVPERELDSDEVDELNIRLNRNTGEWDWDILANEWEMENLVNSGFTVEQFTGSEVKPEDEDKPKKKVKTCPHCGLEI